MKASDVMTPNVVSVGTDTPVPDIATLMLERRISAVAVVDGEGRAVGVVSEGDLIRRPELETDKPRSRWLLAVSLRHPSNTVTGLIRNCPRQNRARCQQSTPLTPLVGPKAPHQPRQKASR